MTDREQFEAWFIKSHWNMKLGGVMFVDNQYTHGTVQNCWASWQACAATKQAEIEKLQAEVEILSEALKKLLDICNTQLGVDYSDMACKAMLAAFIKE